MTLVWLEERHDMIQLGFLIFILFFLHFDYCALLYCTLHTLHFF